MTLTACVIAASLIFSILVLLEIATAPRMEDDACDDRECGTDASMDYEHEVATDGGRDGREGSGTDAFFTEDRD